MARFNSQDSWPHSQAPATPGHGAMPPSGLAEWSQGNLFGSPGRYAEPTWDEGSPSKAARHDTQGSVAGPRGPVLQAAMEPTDEEWFEKGCNMLFDAACRAMLDIAPTGHQSRESDPGPDAYQFCHEGLTR